MNKEVNTSSQFLKTDGGKTKSNAVDIPSISLPKGGGAIKGIDEKFSVNASNGTASFSIALPFSPARGASPSLNLSYNSGTGNGIFGLGWSLSLPSIKRKTGKQLPQYSDGTDSDTFLFSEVEDLVPEFKKETDGSFTKDADGNYVINEKDAANGLFTIRFYKPRIEGSFARIERWRTKTTGEIKWRVITKENVTTLFGWSAASRISDPKNANKIFEWLPEFVFDDKGNCAHYSYKKEDDGGLNTSLLHNRNRTRQGNLTYTNLYLEKVLYGNKTPYKNFTDDRPPETDYLFQTVFDYGEYGLNAPYTKIKDWDFRIDTCSDYKAGFEIRITRLCKRVLLFHYFAELPGGSALVKSLNFGYYVSAEKDFTFLKSITSFGYIKQADGTYTYKSLLPIEFDYQQHDWSKNIKSIAQSDLIPMPLGLNEPMFHFIDLFNEGLSGILTEQAGSWYYKRNLGDGKFEQAKLLSSKPSFAGLGGKLQLADLDADGGKQLVSYSTEPRGYFELDNGLDNGNEWQGLRPFRSLPNIDFSDTNMRMLDLDGDGKPELVISEDQVFTWYQSEGRNGYGQAHKTPKSFNEDDGPHIIFADSKQSIYLADMSGDGMTDIVRIRNGEVCYWPNLGYGKFGAKLVMDNAPVFDHPNAFNPDYLRLADIDGSGTSDIIYLGKNKFTCWKNLSGNHFSTTPFEIDHFAEIHSQGKITVTDLLGNGMACIVWSSPLLKHSAAPLKYIDLMNNKKPYIMVAYKNNLGKEVSFEYKPSTHFYLEDKKVGNPWVTKLHFPIHCVSKTITEDKISGSKFVTEYKYHHGYYDHAEREFRGFGMVEQIDAETFEHWQKGNAYNIVEEPLHQAPVVKKTWYHTGAFLQKEKILDQFAKDYWYEEIQRQGFPANHHEAPLADAKLIAPLGLDPSILASLSSQEWREAFRACKGMELRSEVFAKDAKKFDNTEEARKKELTPFSVATHNCVIKLLQPKGKNKHAIFLVNQSETRTYNYERNAEDPRIAHTLHIESDEYGNVLESAAIVYPRMQVDAHLPAETQRAQRKTTILYTKNSFSNDVSGDNDYRLRVPAEVKTYEMKGVAKAAAYYDVTHFTNVLSGSAEVAYHQTDINPEQGTAQIRLLEHIRNIYYKNDLTGALLLNQLESKGLLFESCQLAYTPELVTDIFGPKVNAALLAEGKFIHSEGDNNWWIGSGITQFIADTETVIDAQNRFYTPIAYSDPFGAVTKTKYYGSYFLFIEETDDAFGNKAKVDLFNFRTLSPRRMRDINNNISEVLTDELGLVKAMAIMGKGNDADDLTGLDEFTTDAENINVANLFNASNSIHLANFCKTALQHATARFVYDLDVYKNSGKPVVVASIIREAHFQNNNNSPVQVNFEYSNGLGQVVMTKTQAAPGLAKKVIVNSDNTFTIAEVNTAASNPKQLRWIGNGRTVLNNKGNKVKQYEPYFSLTHQYEDLKELVETGSTPKLYYDAVGRLIKTEMPDGTFSKIAFDSWKQAIYDANDTVLDSLWYINRINRPIDDQLTDPEKEKQAADKAAKHANTPNVQHFDTMGRPVLSVEHNRHIATGEDEFCHTNIELDAEGNLRNIIDAHSNTITKYKYDMLGNMVYQKSMDAGQRWLLINILDSPLRTWDERDHEFQYFYDILHRPTRSVIINNVGNVGDQILDHVFDRVIYGEDFLLPDGSNRSALQARNVLGKPIQHYDTAGLIDTHEYDFKEQALTTTRKLSGKYKEVANWIDANLLSDLEPESYTFITETDALRRVTKQTAPDGSIITHTYNEAGLLSSVTVVHTDPASAITYIKDVDYNEKGQRNKIICGNDVITRFYYDKETLRLKRLESKRQNDDPLQDWYYTYDPVGNITHIENKNIKEKFFDNKKIVGVSEYTYDALYRLIEATGRESNFFFASGSKDNWNDAAFMQAINPGDPMAIRNYTQRYQYDSAGNILKMRHQAEGNNWTRYYNYQPGQNRLASTQIGTETFTYLHHAQHGFMIAMPHLENIGWNFKEEVIKTIRQKRNDGGTPETTYYQYDSQGQRIRKITENQAGPDVTPTKKEDRTYIAGYERYKKYSGADAGLQRTSLSLVEDTQRFVMIETRNDVDDGTEKHLVRYQLHNHLGSATLELDSTAQVISYEEYHPYGTTAYQAKNAAIKSASKRYRYTGMERDEESGFEYHSARYYVPWLGRWLSCDPLYKDNKMLDQDSTADNEKGNNTNEKKDKYYDNNNPEAFGLPYQYPHEDYGLEKSNGQWRKPQQQLNPISSHEHSLPGKEDLSDLRNLNLYAYAALDPIVYQDTNGKWVMQAWSSAWDSATDCEKVGLGIAAFFAWIVHVIVNLAILIFAVFVQNLLWWVDFSHGALQSSAGLITGVIFILLGAKVTPHWLMGAQVEAPEYIGHFRGFSLGPVATGPHGFSQWKHEFGHTWQSRALGPLYLIIIGIPSAAGADFTEDWADAWGTEI